MKKFAMVCLLALPVAAATNQPASAWFRFKVGASAHVSLCSGGIKWSFCGSQPPPESYAVQSCGPACGPHGCYYPNTAAAWQANASSAPAAPYTSTAAAKVPAPANYAQSRNQSGFQTVGYSQTSGANYRTSQIGYYQAPYYWYGR